MADPANNFDSSEGPRAPARSVSDDLPLWAGREVDIAALRRWFVRRIAEEALKEIKREDQHVHGD
jgi:hypothetical protein